MLRIDRCVSVQNRRSHQQRQNREVKLAPEPALSVLVLNEIRPQRHCGALGIALNYGIA